MAERFFQISGDSMNQGIGTSLPLEEKEGGGGGGGHIMFLIKGGTFECGGGGCRNI